MNEIITYGQNYKFVPGIKVLIKSAKRFCDKLTLINFDLPSDVVSFCNEQNVNIVDAKSLAKQYNVDTNLSPYTLKVIFFYLYIKHISNATNVFMCDLTDVYVQGNVFQAILNNKPYVSSEYNLIGKCETNTTWMNLCYNSDIFNLLKTKEILNGGMYLGTRISLTSLFKELCLELTQVISRIGNYLIPDQAALNKMVYFDLYNYNIIRDFSLLNLAHCNKSDIKIHNNEIYFNECLPYIIHQYKVVNKLEEFLYEYWK